MALDPESKPALLKPDDHVRIFPLAYLSLPRPPFPKYQAILVQERPTDHFLVGVDHEPQSRLVGQLLP